MKALAAGVVLSGGMAIGQPADAAAPQSLGVLAPEISFTFGGAGTLGQFGASVGVDASYTCGPTLDSPVLPQALGSSSAFTLQITEDIAHNGTQTITRASRTLTDLTCDGSTHSGPIYAATDAGMLPLLAGDGVAVVTMRVCDLLGCAAASSVGVVEMV